MNCELKAMAWILEDNEGKLHWDKGAIADDIHSFPEDHEVGQFFKDAEDNSPDMIENWMENCEMKTIMELMENFKRCDGQYTEEQHQKLEEIIHKNLTIVSQNMCVRALFGVGCECNDWHGNPLASDDPRAIEL